MYQKNELKNIILLNYIIAFNYISRYELSCSNITTSKTKNIFKYIICEQTLQRYCLYEIII